MKIQLCSSQCFLNLRFSDISNCFVLRRTSNFCGFHVAFKKQFLVSPGLALLFSFFRFLADKKFERDVVVRHPYRHVPQIEFFKQADEKPPRDRKLCKLSIVPPSTGVRYFLFFLITEFCVFCCCCCCSLFVCLLFDCFFKKLLLL